MYDVDRLRQEEFPQAARLTYLNNAAITPLPLRTQEASRRVIEQLGRNPAQFWAQEAMPAGAALAAAAATHIGAPSPEDLVLATSTSAAINAVAQSIPWRPRDNVILCDVEFPSNAYPWMNLQRDGVEIRCVPADKGGLTRDRVAQHADEHTRVVAVSSVQFFTGHRTDLKAIGEYCRDHGIIFAVDAIQSIGHTKVDVTEMHIDVLASGGQKSLMALPGVGLLYVRRELAETLSPRFIHSNSTANYLHWLAYDMTPAPGTARFNVGTTNLPGMFSISASLELIHELGIEKIDNHTTQLTRYACHELSRVGLEVITPPECAGPIATFRSPHSNADTDVRVMKLAEKGISVTKHLDAAGEPYIRLSFHCYNTTGDVDRFLEAYTRD